MSEMKEVADQLDPAPGSIQSFDEAAAYVRARMPEGETHQVIDGVARALWQRLRSTLETNCQP